MFDHSGKETDKREIVFELSDRSLPKAEESLIRKVLREKHWNLGEAARELGIAQGSLCNKIKRHGIKKSIS